MRTILVILILLFCTLSSFAQNDKAWLGQRVVTYSNDSTFYLGQYTVTSDSIPLLDLERSDSIVITDGFFTCFGMIHSNYYINFLSRNAYYSKIIGGLKTTPRRFKNINILTFKNSLSSLIKESYYNKANNIDLTRGANVIHNDFNFIYLNSKLFKIDQRHFNTTKLALLLRNTFPKERIK